MKNGKKQFRIGHVAKIVGVKRFVLRFWEKEFNLSAPRTTGGQRFYGHDDIEHFKKIKELLYNKGFTIAGAKKTLEESAQAPTLASNTPVIEGALLVQEIKDITIVPAEKQLTKKILALQQQLIKLRELL